MRTLLSTTAAALMLVATFTSCQKEEVSELAAPGQDRTPTKYEYMARQMQQKNMGNGALFIEQMPGGGVGFTALQDVVFDPVTFTLISGEAASFFGEYGTGDFMRQNPDGTVSVKIVDNSAAADYSNFGTQENYFGTGHVNIKFSGTLVTFEVPFPPFTMSLVSLDPNQNALRVNGHADVTLNGEPGEEHDLTMSWLLNPGGQGGVGLTFN